MRFDHSTLLNWRFDDIEHAYSARDTILYELGLGYGSDPTDERELRFVYEEKLAAYADARVHHIFGGSNEIMRKLIAGL
jgi:alkylation response protein AidB-like acyl-CoA dehydrogenase